MTEVETVPPIVTIIPDVPAAPGNAEDVEAKVLLAKWDDENGNETPDTASLEGDELEPLDYDDGLEKYRRDVVADNNALDHIMLGTSDLELAVKDFEEMTGLKPEMVLSLNGLGTMSARVAFESCCYLEIIGPDPKQGNSFPMKTKLESLPAGELVPLHYAVRHKEATGSIISDFLPGLGFATDSVTMVAKDRGMPWKWDLVFLDGHNDGGLAPMYCNWGDATHGAAKLPIVGSMKRCTVHVSSANKIKNVLAGVDGIDVKEGSNLLEFEFSSPKGSHTFSSSSPIGISFPMTGGLNC